MGFTKRRVKLIDVGEKYVKVFCLERMAPRKLLIDSVLTVEPAGMKKTVRKTS